ncbi:M3 family metallopeptidase [Micropruina sonneratiae]|uniref:M3 family metallopeptidase n=1 Tax=Micropruina sonneratiae TaxID=2986940 RepID=UPI00222724BE|nr:M3 family metallopeptidase [Micropruina sp. KQZ13P-5]MCW3159111.1 Zn-dependent oligopeptidase [Micropruina sp. KQZ13P-5]
MALTPLELPADDWIGWLDERGPGQLDVARAAIAELKRSDPERVLALWNDAAIARRNAGAVAGLLSSVHPEAAVIEAAEALEVEADRYSTDLYLDTDVYAALNRVDRDSLDAGAGRVLDKALQSFRRSGVDRDEEVRNRVRELEERLTELVQAFSRNIRDGRRETRVPASALAGLPTDYVESHPADADGLVAVSTDYPDVLPFLTFSTDPDARRAVATTFFNLAWPVNDEVLAAMLAARHELATLLGYPGWPDYDAEVKMIGSGAAIADFIDTISAAAEASARRDLAVLAERAAADGETVIDLSNWRHYYELIKRERFGVDAHEVRRYFDFGKVHDGLLTITGRLFGLRFTPVEQGVARTWHPDVTTFDVSYAADGAPVGRIHLDLHPRERKYNHAAQFELVAGIVERQLPEGVLVCNFPRGLMEHRDVVTLFHEFGHLIHHLLGGGQRWLRFSGVATEWDFVEAPSQLLEEWAWDAEVLRLFATDAEGAPIPEALVQRMRAADEFGKGLLARTQMFYATLAHRFHAERPADPTAAMLDLYETYSMVKPLAGTHFYAGFGHLAGYTSAYYTYMWSLVIAKDLFSAFDPDNLLDPTMAGRYRDAVLVPGGSADAADLVEDFLGRPYRTEAFERWLNS